MKNNFKFLIVLTILLAGCLCIGSTFAADVSVSDINDVSSVDDTQNIEIAHDDSSQKDVEVPNNLTDSNLTGSFNITIKDTVYDSSYTINITDAIGSNGEKLNGTVVVTVNGRDHNVTIVNGAGFAWGFDNFPAGTYLANASLTIPNYDVMKNSTNFTIHPKNITIKVSVEDHAYGENLTGVFKTEFFKTGNISVTINGTVYNGTVDSEGKFTLNNTDSLDIGSYKFPPVTFISDDGNYAGKNWTEFEIYRENINISATVNNITYGENLSGSITAGMYWGNVTIYPGAGSTKYKVYHIPYSTQFDIEWDEDDILGVGTYIAEISFISDDGQSRGKVNVSFTIAPKTIDINATLDNITYGDNVSGKVNTGMNGTVVIQIVPGSSNPTLVKVNESGEFSVPISLPAGVYENVSVSFLSDDGNYIGGDNCVFHISRKDMPINATINNITYGDNLSGSVSADLPGMISIYPGEGTISYEFDTTGPFTTEWDEKNILGAGTYTGQVIFLSDDGNYIGKANVSYNIAKADPEIGVEIFSERAFEIKFGDTVVGIVNLPEDATGNVSFSIDNETWETVPITDDKEYVEYDIPGLDAGNYILFVKYNGDNNYNPNYSENPFNIRQLETTVTVDPVKGKAGEKVTITARVTDEDGNPVEDGYVIIGFNGKEYKAYVENGIATVEVVLPSAGTYSATAYYEGFNYDSSYTTFTVEVSAVPGPNPTPINGGGNMENTGNPLLVLLIALSAIGLESLRRKF